MLGTVPNANGGCKLFDDASKPLRVQSVQGVWFESFATRPMPAGIDFHSGWTILTMDHIMAKTTGAQASYGLQSQTPHFFLPEFGDHIVPILSVQP